MRNFSSHYTKNNFGIGYEKKFVAMVLWIWFTYTISSNKSIESLCLEDEEKDIVYKNGLPWVLVLSTNPNNIDVVNNGLET